MSRWEWSQLGASVVFDVQPGGAYDLTVSEDGYSARVGLPVAAVRELLEHLIDAEGCLPLEQAIEDANAQEARAERAEHEIAALTRQLAEAQATIEQHRTALDLADQRVRGLERDVERMRGASLDPYEPPSIKVRRS